jgi:hypothetical protein
MRFGMAWACCKNWWYKDGKVITGRQSKWKTSVKVDKCCQTGLEKYACNRLENKTCGKNRMIIYREGRLDQTSKEAEIEES